MKKIALLFSAALLMLAASCTNQEIVSDEAQPLKLNITVADLGGPDTKAAKKDWVAGDKLNLWFDDNDVQHTDPDLVITYSGTEWEASSLRSGVSLKANGAFSVVYESTNNLASFTSSLYSEDYYFNPPRATFSNRDFVLYDQCFCRPLIITARSIAYSYSSNTLSATISTWDVCSHFKVLIKDVPSGLTAADYILKVYNDTNRWTAIACSGFSLKTGSSFPDVSGNISGNNNGFAGGVEEPDGIAFYYGGFWCYNPMESPADCDITFTLYEGDSAQKTYTVSGKRFDPNFQYCYNVSLKYSSFN